MHELLHFWFVELSFSGLFVPIDDIDLRLVFTYQ